jgi:hypothetical protein
MVTHAGKASKENNIQDFMIFLYMAIYPWFVKVELELLSSSHPGIALHMDSTLQAFYSSTSRLVLHAAEEQAVCNNPHLVVRLSPVGLYNKDNDSTGKYPNKGQSIYLHGNGRAGLHNLRVVREKR